jgi:hypothetical protein
MMERASLKHLPDPQDVEQVRHWHNDDKQNLQSDEKPGRKLKKT